MTEYESGGLAVHSSTHAEIAENILALRDLYSEVNLSIAPTSSLGILIRNGLAVARGMMELNVAGLTTGMVIQSHHINRIAAAALPLRGHPHARHHLWALKKGSLDPFLRERSVAKDKLWELELWSALNSRSIPATLEEPDVVARTPSGEIAVACKRLYSPANVESQMSDGVAQIASAGRPGILALCIEDIAIPPHHQVRAGNIHKAADMLNQINRSFLNAHHETLRRYASTGRVMSVLVATASVVSLSGVGYRHCTQMQYWVHPTLEHSKLKHMKEFELALMRDLPALPERPFEDFNDESVWTDPA